MRKHRCGNLVKHLFIKPLNNSPPPIDSIHKYLWTYFTKVNIVFKIDLEIVHELGFLRRETGEVHFKNPEWGNMQIPYNLNK